jgi:hypothetical protein
MGRKADNRGMTFLLAFAGIGIVGLLAQRFGADSRPGLDESEPLS